MSIATSPFLAQDKLLHFIVGVLVYAIFHFISIDIALLAVFSAGLGKEVYDFFSPKFHTVDVYDGVATGLGGITAFICGL